MSTAWQESLFGGGTPAGDPSFAGLARRALDGGSWVDLARGWLSGPDTLLADLVATAPWQQRERRVWDRDVVEPRLTAGWAVAEAPEAVRAVAATLDARYRAGFDSVWCNLYRDGRDSVAWHRDRVHRVLEQPVVAIVSLGTTRRFGLRPRAGGATVWLEVAGGDLLVMGGRCQQDWEHTVPKAAAAGRAGPRVSVTYRHSAPAPAPPAMPQAPPAGQSRPRR